MKSYLMTTLAALLCSSVAFAQANKSPAPKEDEPETTVLSDSLTHDDATKTSTFSGNVTLTRGLMRLTADKLTLTEDKKGFKHGKASVDKGKQVLIFEERPLTYEMVRALGNSATYNGETEVVNLIGHAIITRYVCGLVVDTVRGETVTYNRKANTYAATGGPSAPDNGRVRSVVQPRSKADEATAECRKKYAGKPMPSKINSKP